ncbi:MAG: DUF2141 domain-containing protein [Pseudomonadota bacterium]
MKHFAILTALLLPQFSHAGDLQLTLNGTGFSGKNLYVAVHSSAADFPVRDAKAIKSTVVASGHSTELLIPNIAPGEYAVAVFADVNGNGALDNNFIGIPKEPVGMSRDAKGKFGPPKFADAAFKVGTGLTQQTIQIK